MCVQLTITSKYEMKDFRKNISNKKCLKFFHHFADSFKPLRSRKMSKDVDFSLWGKQRIVPKLNFFPSFSSLCHTTTRGRFWFDPVLMSEIESSMQIFFIVVIIQGSFVAAIRTIRSNLKFANHLSIQFSCTPMQQKIARFHIW